jgi:hypothetical protein
MFGPVGSTCRVCCSLSSACASVAWFTEIVELSSFAGFLGLLATFSPSKAPSLATNPLKM